MKLKKREDGWWIVETPESVLEMGPYTEKTEAEADLKGVEKSLKSVGIIER